MLTKKQILILFVLTLIPFLFYAFGRSDIVGCDSYAFLLQSCEKETVFYQQPAPPLAKMLLPLIPCNILAIKLLLFCLCFVSVLGLAYLGMLFSEKNGWRAGYLVWLAPILIIEFSKFENDQFAYPFLFWAAYFFYKSKLAFPDKGKELKNAAVAIALVLVASGFWGGSLYYLVAFALSSIFGLMAAVPIILLFGRTLFDAAMPNPLVAENTAIVGASNLLFLLFGYNGTTLMILPPLLFFSALILLNAKFAVLIVPFLVVGMLNFIEGRQLIPLTLPFLKNFEKNLKQFLPYVAVCLVVFSWGLMTLAYPPRQFEWDAIEYALEQSEDNSIQNDWNLGWWVMWHNGITDSLSSYSVQRPFEKGIVVTRENLDCKTLKEFPENLTVYKC